MTSPTVGCLLSNAHGKHGRTISTEQTRSCTSRFRFRAEAVADYSRPDFARRTEHRCRDTQKELSGCQYRTCSLFYLCYPCAYLFPRKRAVSASFQVHKNGFLLSPDRHYGSLTLVGVLINELHLEFRHLYFYVRINICKYPQIHECVFGFCHCPSILLASCCLLL